MRVGILTISDRSAAGERPDKSGPMLRSMMERHNWQVAQEAVVPDSPERIKKKMVDWADGDEVDLILSTGGTGFGPRDNTPEATKEICDRLAPGLAEAMRAASLRITPYAMLSRAVAGIRGKTLIINLPGSPKGAKENLEVVLPALEHAVQLLTDSDQAESGHHPPNQRKHL